jgi:pyruvate formate lyase activating enzyme
MSSRPGEPPASEDPVGTIYDIQGFSVQDGPGIRTTVFLKGCPLRCPWCHSPESQRFDIQLSWQWRKCIGTEVCGACLAVCPHGAIRPAEPESSSVQGGASGEFAGETGGDAIGAVDGDGVKLIRIDWSLCDDCGKCTEACPAGALSMWGKRYSVAEVVERVLRDSPFFEKSGGGVTISGGEPLAQPEFTLALLKALKGRGMHTALDTTGLAPADVVDRALPYTDLFLLDLKSMDNTKHRAAVGVPNKSVLENARRIAAGGGKIQVRVPVIPRFNDSDEDLQALGTFLEELGTAVTIVQLLPYHAMGVPKWERIKHNGPVLEAVAPSDELIEGLKAVLEGYGLTVQVH